MSTFTTLDRALKAAGWRFDGSEESFCDGDKRLHYRKVLGLVPGMTLDELARCQDDQHDKLAARRAAAKRRAKVRKPR